MLKLFKNLTKRDIIYAVISIALVVVQVWLELTMPDYTQKLTASASSGIITMEIVWQNGGMMMLCALGSLIASFLCGYFAANIAANFARTLRTKMFDKVTDFSGTEYNHFSTPSLITRTTNDIVQMQNLIAMGLQVLIRAPIMAIWAITKISNTSVEWTTAVIIAVVVILSQVGTLVALCYPRFKKIQRLTDDLNDATRENISGVRVVRAFNAETYQEKKFNSVNEEITANNLFTSRTMGLMNPIMTVCMNGLTLAIYWIGAVLINKAGMPDKAAVMGNMVAFTQYSMQIVMSFMMLTAIFIILPRNMVSARRINEVLETQPVITYWETPVNKSEQGCIEFKNVSFAYQDAANPCLHNLSFTVKPGETFAIIGATGSGKSTLINLLLRFYDVTEGQILLDGTDIREYPRQQLENMISVAPQKAMLFSGDVYSNVTYGSPNTDNTDERVNKALGIAQAEFVYELKEGVHAPVSQGGTNFSGGQKQRISIARCVYRNAEIYIFDDTFSALDFKTDMLVRKALHENLDNRTIIQVAQRIGTIMNANHIMVLDEGRIVGIGTHKELLENCPVYKEIALTQLSEEEL